MERRHDLGLVEFHKQELDMQTLSEWQIVLLDNGVWIVPILGILALVVFPWEHWNSIISRGAQDGKQ